MGSGAPPTILPLSIPLAFNSSPKALSKVLTQRPPLTIKQKWKTLLDKGMGFTSCVVSMLRPGDGRTQQWEDKVIISSRQPHPCDPVAQLNGHAAVVVTCGPQEEIFQGRVQLVKQLLQVCLVFLVCWVYRIKV